MSAEAYDDRDNWYPTQSPQSLGQGQIPGNPDLPPRPTAGDQADDNR